MCFWHLCLSLSLEEEDGMTSSAVSSYSFIHSNSERVSGLDFNHLSGSKINSMGVDDSAVSDPGRYNS